MSAWLGQSDNTHQPIRLACTHPVPASVPGASVPIGASDSEAGAIIIPGYRKGADIEHGKGTSLS